MSNSLFDTTPEPPALAARLAPRLHSLAEQGVCFGTSSWKYEGWMGSIYSRDRYLTRGKFSDAKFKKQCLKEYAETLPIVGFDFTFYTVRDETEWDEILADAPTGLGVGLKVSEHVTVPKWPEHGRAGKNAGQRNQTFLDADYF